MKTLEEFEELDTIHLVQTPTHYFYLLRGIGEVVDIAVYEIDIGSGSLFESIECSNKGTDQVRRQQSGSRENIHSHVVNRINTLIADGYVVRGASKHVNTTHDVDDKQLVRNIEL